MSNIFRTKVRHSPIDNRISHKDTLLMMGSCFTQHVGHYFLRYGFDIQVNPFGITYNPLIIAQHIQFLCSTECFNESSLTENQGIICSFQHHGSFSGNDKQQVLHAIQEQLEIAKKQIKKCNYLFLTFGTNAYYIHKERNEIVNNCHKFPASHFSNQMAQSTEITSVLGSAIQSLRKINPTCNIIFTVSPIRYLQDGNLSNSIQKSHLFIAIEQVMKTIDHCYYFPSYEIILDDLRDYRFYKEDMLHPNDMAIKYLWSYVHELLLDASCTSRFEKMNRILKMILHKPIQENSPAHQKFLAQLKEEITVFRNQNPDVTSSWEAYTFL